MIKIGDDIISSTRFPDNTTQVWHLSEDILKRSRCTVTWEYSCEGEIVELAQLVDLLRASGMGWIELDIKYLPFARQDKTISNETTFALHSFAKLLNAIGFNDVYIRDPHSSVAVDLINHATAYYTYEKVRRVFDASASDLICYPDSGALEKYSKRYYLHKDFIYGIKVRNQSTGRIESYNLVGECASKRVLIVDDICDGGATFELLAKDLYAAGAQAVNLFVTHGIFSKGLRGLHHANIIHIYTAKGEAVNGFDGIIYKDLP